MTRDEVRQLVCDALATVGTFGGDGCDENAEIEDWPMETRESFMVSLVELGLQRGVGVLLGVESVAPPITVGQLVDRVEASI